MVFHMANLSLCLLFFYCIGSCLLFLSHGGSLSFAFPSQTDIKLDNSAYFQGDKLIQLTPNTATGNLGSSFGWATFNKSIPLWDSSSKALANFSTHFQFIIGKVNDLQRGFGDGLAFFMAPFDLEQPPYASGAWIGLFNGTTYNGSLYQIVAVEFDTYKNYWDPDDNHVGIDVNSIFSKVNVLLSNETSISHPIEQDLKNDAYWDAWVDYDGGRKQFQVFLLYNPSGNVNNISKPGSPILSYDIDLRDHLPESIKVGLSASTGYSIETHTVSAWNFSCDYSWKISATTPTNSGAVGDNPSIASPTKRRNNNSIILILIAVFPGVLALCGFVCVCWSWYFRKGKSSREANEKNDTELDEWFAQGPRKFSYADLRAATKNFSEDKKLGQGGFGGVYRGILPVTTESVAVKRISQASKQGRKEYVSEVTIISKLRHRNLVQLLGWCHQKGELLLVYEYLPNGSLDKYLFGEQKVTLDWGRRYSIACDIASALVYLHEEWDQRVVHRDIKASNVMLDADFNGKVGDFGLARLLERDHAASDTTVVAGTYGYLAPECVLTGKASTESDVYSFGAVALEIACGRRPLDNTLINHNTRLVEWVWDLHRHGKILDGADVKLGGNFNGVEMERLMLVGLLCSHPDPKTRPTIREAIKILKLEAELPYVSLDLPETKYSYKFLLRPQVTSLTSITMNSSGIVGESLSSKNVQASTVSQRAPLA
ncbi:hypothetical protein KI387_008578 [Taxus chinensis]|uniref:non-specific serine/threonine protein kinase n=1 Tax=Taxus chinensis TaxID=29808 RepID=A0AA38CXG7_TAXCH|nr:hypothetical protein KI387_008578 [Taxus chinensis]